MEINKVNYRARHWDTAEPEMKLNCISVWWHQACSIHRCLGDAMYPNMWRCSSCKRGDSNLKRKDTVKHEIKLVWSKIGCILVIYRKQDLNFSFNWKLKSLSLLTSQMRKMLGKCCAAWPWRFLQLRWLAGTRILMGFYNCKMYIASLGPMSLSLIGFQIRVLLYTV